jgi:cysteine desulfuration protein SufE
MNSAQIRQQQIIERFSKFSTWEERYKEIINLGKKLPELPENMKTEEALVKGCQSQVWLHADFKEGKIFLRGDSDAVLVKGLVALVLQIYSNSTPKDILETPPEFLKDLGFEGNLSPNRSNGLHSMLKQIKYFAIAFQAMMNH